MKGFRIGIVVTLIGALLAVMTAPAFHAEVNDDAGCEPVVVSHDTTQHRVGAAEQARSLAGEHCAICHLIRSTRDSDTPDGYRTHAAHRRTPHVASTVACVSPATLAAFPARAPPSLS